MTQPTALSRRERQIMEILFRLQKASAAQVRENLVDAPSYSAVRALLRILEEKGHVQHEQDGPRYIFKPTVSNQQARQSALKQLVGTFFEGSPARAVAELLSSKELNEDELEELEKLIHDARQEGR